MDYDQRVLYLEHQVRQLNKLLLGMNATVQAQRQQQDKIMAVMSDLVAMLKIIFRNGFDWKGNKVDVDHGMVNGLADNDHLQYLETFNNLVILTDNDVNPGTFRTWETWEPL